MDSMAGLYGQNKTTSTTTKNKIALFFSFVLCCHAAQGKADQSQSEIGSQHHQGQFVNLLAVTMQTDLALTQCFSAS